MNLDILLVTVETDLEQLKSLLTPELRPHLLASQNYGSKSGRNKAVKSKKLHVLRRWLKLNGKCNFSPPNSLHVPPLATVQEVNLPDGSQYRR